MNNRPLNKKGMLVLVLAAGLVFISIIFASITNRMRAEALITNRVSINERLNQFASAIGRLAIRKLQRDIELVDTDYGHGKKIVDLIVDEKKSNTEVPLADYTNVLEDMAVVQDLKKTFEEKFGKQGKIDTFKVEYKLNLGNAGFPSSPMRDDPDDDPNGVNKPGVIRNTFERKGYVDMIVTVGIPYGVTRKYTVRKDFVFARLLAPPFYRFTLFSPNGANIQPEKANACELDDTGKLRSGTRPFVCLNRRLAANNQTRTATNYVAKPDNVIKTCPGFPNPSDAFVKNGWIYLGARERLPEEIDIDENKRLILNVAPGSDDDDIKTKFGEYFHFYYDKSDSGWLIIDNWSNFISTPDKLFNQFFIEDYKRRNNNKFLQISMVNYGLHPELVRNTSFADINLFKDVIKLYEGYSKGGSRASALLNKCSSMHLFGTPKHCTPSLIFGPINRRYLRAFAFFFPKLGRVFPLPAILSSGDFDRYFRNGDEHRQSNFYKWYKSKSSSDPDDGNIIGSTFSNLIQTNFEIYYKGSTSLDSSLTNGIGPLIVDNEPYMKALVNMSDPSNPAGASIATNSFVSQPDDLCNPEDFEFGPSHASESLFLGKFDRMRIDYKKYLLNGTTFTISNAVATEPISIKKNDFIQKYFFEYANGKKYFLLNQIIRIGGDLEIDEELTVAKGGIIIASGSITISEPILNKVIEDGLDKNDPNNFGFLTLIARKGIYIKGYPGSGGEGLPPKLEAFLVAGLEKGSTEQQQVVCDQPIRIIGGVAADRIDSLVEKGCIVEWGLEPGEATDYANRDFYGITLGPRDIELYSAE